MTTETARTKCRINVWDSSAIASSAHVEGLDELFNRMTIYRTGAAAEQNNSHEYNPGDEYVGLLDLVGDAEAAFAVRALSAAVRGQNVILLRRDSDQDERAFATDAVTGLLDLSEMASWLGGANAFVKTWFDQSGNNNHATQADPSLQFPFDVTLPGLSRSSDDVVVDPQYLVTGSNVTLQSATVMCVAKLDAETEGTHAIIGNNAETGEEWLSIGTNSDSKLYSVLTDAGFVHDYAVQSNAIYPASLNSTHVHEVLLDGANSVVRINGVAPAQAVEDFGPNDPVSIPLVIGADDDENGSPWFGEIQEVVVWGSAKSSGNMASARANQANAFNISL